MIYDSIPFDCASPAVVPTVVPICERVPLHVVCPFAVIVRANAPPERKHARSSHALCPNEATRHGAFFECGPWAEDR